MKKLVLIFVFGLLAIFSVIVVTSSNKNQDLPKTAATLPQSGKPPQQVSFSINYLRSLTLTGSDITIEQTLSDGSNYKRYIASYISDGNKIYGLFTVPKTDVPEGGYRAIVFDHGYIPPKQYVTTERYVAYIDYLARAGFVVFKIDFRGNGKSEGMASGSYFSNGYTIDAINALKSLQKLSYVNSQRIGMWGHSMSGNVLLRSMLVSDEIKAGVIWAGAVYSYEDMAKYSLNDPTFVRQHLQETTAPNESTTSAITQLRNRDKNIDFSLAFWQSISLTQNINYLEKPLQINHAKNDQTVNIGYSEDLVKVLKANNKVYEFNTYDGGGHNIDSPYFEEAMKSTVEFFDKYL